MKWTDGTAVHRRRLRVLVRGHATRTRTSIPTPTADDGDQRQAGHDREGRRRHRPLQVFPEPYYLLPERAGRLDADLRPRARGRRPRHGRLRAGPLPEAVPSRSTPARPSSTRWSKDGEVRQLGQPVQVKNDWALNPDLPVLSPWKTVDADQHADLDAGAQPVQRLGRHRRQPAAVHRQDPADAGREPRGAQPARHRRRVRLPGAPHRHRQAAGLPREPAARATTRSTSTPATTAATWSSSST